MSGLRCAFIGIGLLGLCGVLLLTSTWGARTPAIPKVNDEQFHARLLKIAEIYPVYGRVDDDARWSPVFCRAPAPAQAHFSQSSDEGTHGQKLYSLFARGRDAYLQKPEASPVGQIIVKESWVPQELKEKPKDGEWQDLEKVNLKEIKPPEDLAPLGFVAYFGGPTHFHPFAQKKGKWYKAGERGPLFVMMKLDPRTPATDEGWVYGTLSADGKKVTSAGRVASCMKCHESKEDRLFGLSPQTEKPESNP